MGLLLLLANALGYWRRPGHNHGMGACAAGNSSLMQEHWDLSEERCSVLCIQAGSECLAYEYSRLGGRGQYSKCELHSEAIQRTVPLPGAVVCRMKPEASTTSSWVPAHPSVLSVPPAPPWLQPPTSPPAVRLILDTDMGCGACRDVDDVVALCALHALADNGEVELLAVVQDSAPPAGAGVISVVNHFYGRDHIPIGAYKGSGLTLAGEPPLTFVDSVLKAFPSPIRNASQVPDAVDVYRRVLAASPPRSVTIASVGLLTNLELLLRSGPDAHSPLDGPSPSSSSGLTRGEVLVTVSESLPCRLRFGGRKGGSPLNHGGRLPDERASLRRVQCVRLFQRRGRRLQGDRRSRVLFRRSKRAAVRPYHLPRVPRRGRGADWRGDGAVRSAGQPVPARPPRSEQSSSTRPRDQRHR